jgi:Fe-S-cluster containining protein
MINREEQNPCLSCGACCAYYPFYWGEGDDAAENDVPHHLTKKMDFNRGMMPGTGGPEPRCIALLGTIDKLRCMIYERRASRYVARLPPPGKTPFPTGAATKQGPSGTLNR